MLKSMQGMQAMTVMFRVSAAVKCHSCGRDLKGENLQRLARLGCPECRCKVFDYTMSDEAKRRFEAAVGG